DAHVGVDSGRGHQAQLPVLLDPLRRPATRTGGGRAMMRLTTTSLLLCSLAVAAPAGPDAPIDRAALVGRHAPGVRAIDPGAALTVGNGRFAFTVDVTGLQ